jgi:hypothetical protein
LSSFWKQLGDLDLENLIISVAILSMIVAVAIYVILKIRPKPIQSEPPASELLSKFREIHSRGGLTDAEFRTIKTTLAEQLNQQLKDNSEKGYADKSQDAGDVDS